MRSEPIGGVAESEGGRILERVAGRGWAIEDQDKRLLYADGVITGDGPRMRDPRKAKDVPHRLPCCRYLVSCLGAIEAVNRKRC